MKVAALLLILAFGAVRAPLEQSLTQEHRRAYFHGAQLDLGLRAQIGQAAFVAALSGFRSLVSDQLWIQAHSAWERTQWARMIGHFNSVTALQPRVLLFWDNSSWHMAWNASIAALQNPKQPREALRIKAQREYFKIGEDFLLRGIRNNPDRALLYERLGLLYRDKFEDHCKAAEQYAQAAERKDAMSYVKRFAAYELSRCPGHEREAYELLKKLYNMSEDERLPTLLERLSYLQEKLGVPPAERVYTPAE